MDNQSLPRGTNKKQKSQSMAQAVHGPNTRSRLAQGGQTISHGYKDLALPQKIAECCTLNQETAPATFYSKRVLITSASRSHPGGAAASSFAARRATLRHASSLAETSSTSARRSASKWSWRIRVLGANAPAQFFFAPLAANPPTRPQILQVVTFEHGPRVQQEEIIWEAESNNLLSLLLACMRMRPA